MCYSMLIPTITLQQNTARGWISVGALLQSTGVKMKYEPVQFEGLSVAKLENSGLLPRLDYTTLENYQSKKIFLLSLDACDH